MQNLRNPKWILVINTLPVVVLLSIFFGEFSIIESLLEEGNISLWKSFVWVLVALSSLSFIYALYLIIKKKQVSFFYSIAALCTYIPFIYLFGYFSNDIIPFSIPRWMLSGDLMIYVGTFLMPTLAYALFVLVTALTSNKKNHKAWKNFLAAIAIPILLYVFLQVIIPLWKSLEDDYDMHVILIVIIICTLIFLFFLIRGIYILSTRKGGVLKKYQYFWKIPVLILLPILGLLINNGQIFHPFGTNSAGIFGDFNHPLFYILAILNGIFICLPNLEKRNYRLLLIIGRSFTLAFTFYFFIVFLPFLPISVIALIPIGTGFLLLTPLVVFIIHINELIKDIHFLKDYFSKKIIWAIVIGGFLILPISITLSYIQDRNTLHETLDYVYNPDYSKTYNIKRTSLKKTLNVVKNHKGDNRDFIFDGQQPYLSTYFNWLVLDNLTLSNKKINTIERIFFDEDKDRFWSRNSSNKNVAITDIATNSTFDTSQNAWKSWIDLEITNTSDSRFLEYTTTITLPEGAWISDYYLYVGDTKEMGILAEKKSAMWVFSNIRNENRDPGILYYLTGNKVVFKVFPFGENEVRKTGIELLHKDPIQLTIDGHQVQLGEQQETFANFENEHAVYISPQEKKNLKETQRTPYFHFITDISDKKDSANAAVVDQINTIIRKYPSIAENAKISYTNQYTHTEPLGQDWEERLKTQTFEGGFYVDRAIKSVLYNSYNTNDTSYPIIVVVTNDLQSAIFDTNFSDWKFTFPESDFFYSLGEDHELRHHSLITNPAISIQDSLPIVFNHKTLVYQDANNVTTYLKNDSLPTIILKKDLFEIPVEEIKNKDWASALTLQAAWKSQILHPETADKEWLSLVKSSFKSNIMTPVTSYIVVENDAQKAILKKKQQQVLSGKKSLDLGEDTRRMSEPSIYIIAILLGGILWYRKKRQHKLTTYKKKEL